MKTRMTWATSLVVLLFVGLGSGLSFTSTSAHKPSTQALIRYAGPTDSIDTMLWRVPKSVPPPPAPTQVTVVLGDTLGAISTKYQRSLAQFVGWNHLTDFNTLHVGQVLNIPPANYVAPPLPQPAVLVANHSPAPIRPSAPRVTGGIYSYAALESLWIQAGGPSYAAAQAAQIAECESGGKWWAYNPSGATGLWQILGAVVPGNLYDPMVNAENAVAKWRAGSHGTHDNFGQWVCQ